MNYPPLPTIPGYYILIAGRWAKTDGLTARTFAHTVTVR